MMQRTTIIYKKKEILLSLYKTLVRPLVEYCTAAWSPYYQKDKILLELIHHRFTRMFPEFLPYQERLVKLGLWTVEVELCAAALPPPTECRRRAGAVFVKCSRHVVQQLYVARFL